MDLSPPSKRPRGESIVPMINVVFLLLIFFLMTSQLTAPEPFEVTPPEAQSEAEVAAERIVFVSPEGRVVFEEHEGEAAFAALGAGGNAAIQLRADAGMEAAKLAKILRALAEAGLTQVELVVSGS